VTGRTLEVARFTSCGTILIAKALTLDMTTMPTATESAILSRIIEPNQPAMPVPVARLILEWRFTDDDQRRMHTLLEKAKDGTLTRSEKAEAETYERVGNLLSIMKSKARRSLKSKQNGS
jgi:hypothetical protein